MPEVDITSGEADEPRGDGSNGTRCETRKSLTFFMPTAGGPRPGHLEVHEGGDSWRASSSAGSPSMIVGMRTGTEWAAEGQP